MHLTLLLCAAFGVIVDQVKAESMDQLTEDFTGILMECLAENPVSSADLETMTNKQMPDNETARCLFACAYKKTEIMDKDGKLSEKGVRDLSKKYFADDAEKMKISDDFTRACLSVNKEPVKDGTKGCERAAMIFKCSVKNTPKFDFI